MSGGQVVFMSTIHYPAPPALGGNPARISVRGAARIPNINIIARNIPTTGSTVSHLQERICQKNPCRQIDNTRRTCRKTLRVVATAGTGAVPAGSDSAQPLSEKVVKFQRAFWKFLRPHTIRGTLLGTTALVARALSDNPSAVDWSLLPRALLGLLALLCGNGYIVGINQIYDEDGDKINKPYLPVAAGELSPSTAWVLCGLLSLGGLTIVATQFGQLITGLYTLGLVLGTLYSVPPFRLKRFAVPAFLIIATVRGFLLNFGVFYATRAALRLPFEWRPSIVFITSFVTVFAIVIAITKDLPDVEGDKKFKIDTFASRVGVRTVAFLGSGLLLANYSAAIIAAIRMPQAFRVWLMAGGHGVLALVLIYQTYLLDSKKYTQAAVAQFYRFIWNLFYSEYAMLPFL